MANMKIDDVVIRIFDGSDYNNWKIRILKFLQYKKCKEVVRDNIKTDKQPDWDDKNIKTTNDIYNAITNKQLEYVSELVTAYEIMKKFDEMYLKKSTALQIVRRSNLENIKLKDFSEVTKFFDEFEKAVNELKDAGAQVSEQEELNYTLKALPKAYSHIGDIIDVVPEAERTVEYVKSKIKLKEAEERKPEIENIEETTTKVPLPSGGVL